MNHPWFIKTDICKYLLKPFVEFKSNGKHKNLDSEIVDKLFTLKLNIDPEDRKYIETSILNNEMHDFWIAYDYLYYGKMLENIDECDNSENSKSNVFNTKLMK